MASRGKARREAAAQEKRGWRVPLLLVTAVLLVFCRACSCDFVSLDDTDNVVKNPLLNPPSPGSLLAFWRQGYEALFIPVTYTVWGIEALLFRAPGTSEVPGPLYPGPFHAVNLLFHAANAWLVFRILSRLLKEDPHEESAPGREEIGPALAGALLFALHPLQVEPVVWVTGLKDVLSAFLSLVALNECLAWWDAGLPEHGPPERQDAARPARVEESARGRRGRGDLREIPFWQRIPPRTWHFLLATAAYSLALLAKPSAVAVPLLAGVLLLTVRAGRSASDQLRETARFWAGWAVLALPFILLNRALQIDPSNDWIPAWSDRPWIALDAIGFYLAKLLAPVKLACDYARTPSAVLASGELKFVMMALLVLLLLAGLGWARRLLATAGLLFLLAIAPVLGIVPFGFQQYSTVADRYTYMALLGPSLAVAWIAARLSGRAWRQGAALVLIPLAVLTFRQIGVWQNSRTLFQNALLVSPESTWLMNNWAHTLMDEGKDIEAMPILEMALKLKPKYFDARANLGVALAKQNRLPEAVIQFRQALVEAPGRGDLHQNLGHALARLGQTDEGEKELLEAIRLLPTNSEANDQIGILYAKKGDLQKAARHFAQAARLDPANLAARAHAEKAVRQILESGGRPE